MAFLVEAVHASRGPARQGARSSLASAASVVLGEAGEVVLLPSEGIEPASGTLFPLPSSSPAPLATPMRPLLSSRSVGGVPTMASMPLLAVARIAACRPLWSGVEVAPGEIIDAFPPFLVVPRANLDLLWTSPGPPPHVETRRRGLHVPARYLRQILHPRRRIRMSRRCDAKRSLCCCQCHLIPSQGACRLRHGRRTSRGCLSGAEVSVSCSWEVLSHVLRLLGCRYLSEEIHLTTTMFTM